ncbi:hypothetical protein LCGC14_2970500 [marine sediment metagenome]|uniref:Uncharacterized protein n=1 Tax=marine sediment metagenome TaxID=412755 RepID=A0A0F9A0S8_9ZZZZ
MDKVYLIPEHQLDLVNMHILNEVMDGLRETLADFKMIDGFRNISKNNWDILKGSLRFYIEKGFKKWLRVT